MTSAAGNWMHFNTGPSKHATEARFVYNACVKKWASPNTPEKFLEKILNKGQVPDYADGEPLMHCTLNGFLQILEFILGTNLLFDKLYSRVGGGIITSKEVGELRNEHTRRRRAVQVFSPTRGRHLDVVGFQEVTKTVETGVNLIRLFTGVEWGYIVHDGLSDAKVGTMYNKDTMTPYGNPPEKYIGYFDPQIRNRPWLLCIFKDIKTMVFNGHMGHGPSIQSQLNVANTQIKDQMSSLYRTVDDYRVVLLGDFNAEIYTYVNFMGKNIQPPPNTPRTCCADVRLERFGRGGDYILDSQDDGSSLNRGSGPDFLIKGKSAGRSDVPSSGVFNLASDHLPVTRALS